MQTIVGDVRDHEALAAAVVAVRPEVVIHMAAQSLVRRAFANPRETYEITVMGAVNLLESVRCAGNVRAVVIVTSDKCYEDRSEDARAHGPQRDLCADGSGGGHREDSAIGGEDPYSSSKSCVELVTDAYRRSFFTAADKTRVASARAGNAIGGGDWAEDRLIPDLMRAALSGKPAQVRNPTAVRPWQHVLNPLSGYLVLAQALWESPAHACAWNFGPAEQDARPVGWIVERVAELWPEHLRWNHHPGAHPREAPHLRLDSSKARLELGWQPPLDLDAGLAATVDWYRELRAGADMRTVTLRQIQALADSS
jgi:CDP-glucose 4,6-dehydratase